MSINYFDIIPNELLIDILDRLDDKSISKMLQTEKRMCALKMDVIWSGKKPVTPWLAEEITMRIIMVGLRNCGKDALLERQLYGRFSKRSFALSPMAMLNSYHKSYCHRQTLLRVQFVSLPFFYVGHSDGMKEIRHLQKNDDMSIMIVLNLTDDRSIKFTKSILSTIQDPAKSSILIGTNSDRVEDRKVTEGDLEKLAQLNGINYISTSSKTGDNVDYAFRQAIRKGLRQINLDEESDGDSAPSSSPTSSGHNVSAQIVKAAECIRFGCLIQ